MIIKSIKLKNFKNFAEKEISLHDITFFKGANGTGKTTLALESILFAIYGYTPKEKLADLPTRNRAKSCSVTIEIEHNDSLYKIKRSYPTDLIIHKDNELLKFSTSREANDYLTSLFGDRSSFMKFRIIDAYDKETDILSQGQTSIKKIIFAVLEDIFNNAKVKLQAIKSERERFNKDGAIIYTHYPSEKRAKVLEEKSNEMISQYREVMNDLNEFEREYLAEERLKSKDEGYKSECVRQKNKLLENQKCYVCGQGISEEKQKSLLKEVNEKVESLNIKIKKHLDNLEEQKELISQYKEIRDNIQSKKERINHFKMRLETRMKQKEFKYTNRDVLLVKQALEELDKLSSYYLTESIKVLEPIINSILEKINFSVNFTINEKGRFTISLQKDDIEYKYKDLSTGQKLLLQIAFKLAMLMQNDQTGIIIADEGMSSLDSENLQHVLNIFSNYPYQLLFVIHNLEDIPSDIKVIDLNERSIKNERN